jgi:hypothetical protein
MQWSIFPPNKPGIYWCNSRLYDYQPELFEVHHDIFYGHFLHGHPTLSCFREGVTLTVALLSDCKWYGPIEPPPDNEELNND